MRQILVLFLVLVMGGCEKLSQGAAVLAHEPTHEVEQAPAGIYELDAPHSSVHFGVQHLEYSTYLGRFDKMSGTLRFAPDAPTQSVLSVTIQAASVNSGNATIDKPLRDLFGAEKHPEIRFESGEITRTGDTAGTIRGTLTMAGRSRPVELDVTFNGGAPNPLTGAHTLGFSAAGTLQRSDWGLGKWIPAVSNTVELRIEAEFVKRGEPGAAQ